MVGHQLLHHNDHLAVQRFLLDQLPFFKWQAIRQKETGQKIATVQLGSLFQPADADRATAVALMMMALLGANEFPKIRYIKAKAAERVHTNLLVGGNQNGLPCGRPFTLLQGAAQTQERLAEIVGSFLGGGFGPKQGSQCAATMRTIRF